MQNRIWYIDIDVYQNYLWVTYSSGANEIACNESWQMFGYDPAKEP